MVKFRQGEEWDVKQIIDISKEYINREARHENGSFLIRELVIDDVREHIHEFYVAVHKDMIVGYVWINDSYPKLRREHTKFNESADLSNVVYIKQVAVQSAFARKGIASGLYDYLRENNSGKSLVACVAIEPMKNEPSILFHENKGFRQIGVLSLHDYMQFNLYRAVLFLLD
ncbi:MAG: GNAT family N-acetyltransferase [Bacillota bacterium]|nr:GNAT family N-acetyltransferase [Bacillota bacterium]